MFFVKKSRQPLRTYYYTTYTCVTIYYMCIYDSQVETRSDAESKITSNSVFCKHQRKSSIAHFMKDNNVMW